MPYENSPRGAEHERAAVKGRAGRGYRNYYYYKYVPGDGGYSYYTTCMLDTNSMGRIYYKDTAPYPAGSANNVVGSDHQRQAGGLHRRQHKHYNVSTVNYLAAGSCNFNDGGVSLWPLNQIVHDTQYYVRDAVIDYITAMGTVSPAIEGRLLFGDTSGAGDHDQCADGAGLPAPELPDPRLQRGRWRRRHHSVIRGAFGREEHHGQAGRYAGDQRSGDRPVHAVAGRSYLTVSRRRLLRQHDHTVCDLQRDGHRPEPEGQRESLLCRRQDR